MLRVKLVAHSPAHVRMASHPERILRAFLFGFPVRRKGEAHVLTHLGAVLNLVPAQNFAIKPGPEYQGPASHQSWCLRFMIDTGAFRNVRRRKR